MSRRWVGPARVGVGLVVLVALVWRLGPTPFVDGLRRVDLGTLVLGLLLGVPTTVCCAWRWTLVARRMRVALPLRDAVAAYYRSQLINTAVPGGIVGDVHRGVRHGREHGDTGRGLRAVAAERVAGQVVAVVVTAAVLLVAVAPGRAVGLGAGLVVAVVVAAVTVPVLRTRLSPTGTWPGVLLASVGALVGPVATFLVAARVAGVTAPLAHLVPLALLVLLAMAVPLNVAGWGPREGVAAWAFAAAGLGADAGVATAVVYGVMSVAAVLPGALVLVAAPARARREAVHA